ncbi:glycosyltransferase family 2 protein [Clostridium estertheticum]|uniref:glycosyltransferase family 2 protein n=1 Tax=Clostridium estertheticum TaxID=238834 RepID=UPI0013EE54B4|nr:glycosyltransferase family 2 protein [Clostridium estertheticum]MBZ9609308.1 glycosyltransferase family 2 protein [Clostridium estertheticum]
MSKSVYIILVNFNGAKDTIECIKSLNNINYENFKIVVVDNKSYDEDRLKLKEADVKFHLIESNENLGFAGGNNLGIKYAIDNNADFVLLLNNDTLVHKDFLNELIKYTEINVGVIGPKILYYPDVSKIWFAGGMINWFKFIGQHFGEKQEDNGQFNNLKEVDFVTGCCMLIDSNVFKKVGLLPEGYFMYFEDVDFCVKVKDAGYKLIYNPNSEIYHKVSISSGGEESPFILKYSNRNRLKFMKKYKHKVSFTMYMLSITYFYFTRIIKIIKYMVRYKKNKEKIMALISVLKKN